MHTSSEVIEWVAYFYLALAVILFVLMIIKEMK
jgi:hypothetical protein